MNNYNIACYPELAYEGHVKVSIAKGKRIIKSYEYKNTGGLRLLHFLANCAAGNFFDNDRPTRIILFKKNDETEEYVPISTSSGLFYRSAPLVINNTIAAQTSATGNFYQTTLHFTIPYYEIYESTISGARLYSANALSAPEFNAEDYSAAVVFEGDIELDLRDIQQNYMLVIDWELQFKNMPETEENGNE